MYDVSDSQTNIVENVLKRMGSQKIRSILSSGIEK